MGEEAPWRVSRRREEGRALVATDYYVLIEIKNSSDGAIFF